MIHAKETVSSPFYSICIPQYNRTSFLLKAIESFANQTFREFEVCISDDCSSDGRRDELIHCLERLGLSYKLQIQERNLRYDANLRAAMALARGRYCLLMGNDDALAGPTALADMTADIERHGPAGVVIANFADYVTGIPANRIQVTRNYGSGSAIAASHFRNFSFVSGVMLERESAQQYATEKWDGSEMYQMYIGCKMIAGGHRLLELSRVCVLKDIPIAHETVDSYAKRSKLCPCPIVERTLPFGQLAGLVADAIANNCAGKQQQQLLNERILRQVLQFTYPFWLVEYRKVQSWNYAAGVALAMRPSKIAGAVELSRWRRWRVKATYCLATLAGLSAPIRLFNRIQPIAYRLAKRPVLSSRT